MLSEQDAVEIDGLPFSTPVNSKLEQVRFSTILEFLLYRTK